MISWETWQRDVLSREPQKVVVMTPKPKQTTFDKFVMWSLVVFFVGLAFVWIADSI